MGYIDALAALQHDPIWEVLEDGNPCKDPSVYSSSALKNIGGCTWRFKLAHIDGSKPQARNPAGVRGSAVHAAVAKLHTNKKWKDFGDVYQESWDEKLADPEEADLPWSRDVDEKKLNVIMEDGMMMVGQYAQRNWDAPVIATEVPFRMLLEHPRTKTRYRFAGTVDQLRGGGGLSIVDLKSEAAAPNKAYLSRNQQFSSYGLALKKAVFFIDGEPVRFNQYPDEMTWYHLTHLVPYKRAGKQSNGTKYVAGDLRGDPIYPVERTEGDYQQFEEEAMRLIQIIRMGLFTRNVDKLGCTMCDQSHACLTGELYNNGNHSDLVDGFDSLTEF